MSVFSQGVRKGQAPAKLSREEFRLRYLRAYVDPAFDAERAAIDRLEATAYAAYAEGRKAYVNLACLAVEVGDHPLALKMLSGAKRCGFARMDDIANEPMLAPLHDSADWAAALAGRL